MSDNTNPSESDFQDAFAAEMGATPEPVAVAVATPPVVEDAPEEAPVVEDAPVVEEKVESAEEIATRESQEAADAAAAAEPKFATKDDVAAALREYNAETSGRIDKVSAAREEVIGHLYPEGIDKTIYDTNGKVIKTAQDIVDRGLINERTGEAFEYEEAASFMLDAQRQMNQNVEDLNKWAEKVAEENISLVEGNQRVMEKWGETFKTLPKETVAMLADTYITQQLKFDKTNSYITEMNMAPEAFYDLVMAPYSQLSQALAAQATAEAAVKSHEQGQEQAERNGIPPQRGAADVKSNTGDPMVDALIDEMNKG